MGGAFAKGVKQNLQEYHVVVSDRNSSRLKLLQRNDIETTSHNMAAIKNAKVVIIAIKPQDFQSLLKEIKNHISSDTIVISVAAGVKLKTLEKGLNHKLLARVMPNLLAIISKSVSCWFAPNLDNRQKLIVKNILKSIGEEVEMESENDIDKATAISGSGPAYVWYFMESLIKAGVKLGLKEAVSRKLTSQTFLGASMLASAGIEDEKTLRARVTSKGGTTEQAIKIFDKKKLGKILEEAAKNAYKRTKELSK